MKNILRNIISGIGICLLSSCSGFLEQNPPTQISRPEGFRNFEDYDAYIRGIYAVWNVTGNYSLELTLVPDLQCDLAYSVTTSNGEIANIYGWNFNSGEDNVTSCYSSLYKIISNSNLALEQKDNIPFKEEQRAAFQNLVGTAYFSRALAYTELAKLFAAAYDPAKAEQQLGVSIWNTFSVGNPARSSLAQVYTQILGDLAEAKKLITTDQADSKYITVGAVDALYARVCLYMENWTEAANAASRVIANTNYQLADATQFNLDPENYQLRTEFYNMWLQDASDEIIWKLAYDVNNQPGELGRLFTYRNGSSYAISYAPAASVLKMYDTENDGRFYAYFTPITIKGSAWYAINKYPGNPAFQTGTDNVYSNMPKPFRLAEMYLIRAEAYARSIPAREDLANADLSALRSKRIKNYTHEYKTGASLLQEIKDERVKELYMEGHRLYDLKRYHEGFTRTPQIQSLAPDNALKVMADNFRFVWPIPKHETTSNENVQQNPGY